MRNGSRVAVVIPALNEEVAIGKVLSAIPSWVDDVVVVDNGSSDRTVTEAGHYGARVFREPRRGYGSACLTGIRALRNPDVVLFMDADFSDCPEESARLVDPVATGEADLVIGSRVLGRREPGALTPQARAGNWLACLLIHWFWKKRFTDLGPFRAISIDALESLDMCDPDYGWTVEMQVRAVIARLKVKEIPVSYKRRIGKSKVSGTVRGVVGAGTKILGTIFRARAGLLPCRPLASREDRIIVFTRYPEPGRTKTRLIPVLGAEGAADFQRTMAERALKRVRDLEHGSAPEVEVQYEGGNRLLMRRWLGRGLMYREQHAGDLGHRMFMAFSDAFREGAMRVLLVGTDCPGISGPLLERGLQELKRSDLVLGPATDGGYYLIGLKQPHQTLFIGVPWGTPEVLGRTLEIARSMHLSTVLLDRLDDVDRPEDLAAWEQAIASDNVSQEGARELRRSNVRVDRDEGSATNHRDGEYRSKTPRGELQDNSRELGWGRLPDGHEESECVRSAESLDRLHPSTCSDPRVRISVIIPTLNEAETLPEVLHDLKPCRGVEIIVVDGGSGDRTAELAHTHGAGVLHGPAGRAGQMNLGAAAATGEILLFLHADTSLPRDWMEQIDEVLADRKSAGGAFHLGIRSNLRGIRVIEKLANLRAKRFHMPYGDQAIFLRAELFRKIGGFPDLPIMEDFEFIRRLRRWGEIGIAPGVAITSGRHWSAGGVLLTTVINQLIIAGYLLGISPRVLARLRPARHNSTGPRSD